MKKISLLILFVIFGSAIVSAQVCDGNFLGTKTLYKKQTSQNTPEPAGFSAVFINHVGRHRARHLTKSVESYFAYALLLKADSADQLSADGLKLEQMVLALQRVENNNAKSISIEGKSELEGISERMYENYSNVFKVKAALNIRITKEIRTKQSADVFLLGLNKKLPILLSTEEHNDDTDLRFYDLSPAIKNLRMMWIARNLKYHLIRLCALMRSIMQLPQSFLSRSLGSLKDRRGNLYQIFLVLQPLFILYRLK